MMKSYKIEDWLKLGAFVYVGLEILATFIGRAGILIRRPGNPEEWGAALMSMIFNTLSAAIQGALYYLMNLLRETGFSVCLGLLLLGLAQVGGSLPRISGRDSKRT